MASYSIVDYSSQDYAGLFSKSHIELRVTFSTGSPRTPVDVKNPEFVIKDSDGNIVPNVYILRPLQKIDSAEVGKYRVTFLTNNLYEGTYSVEFTGEYDGTTLKETGTFTLKTVLRTQYFIDLLRTSLGDKYNLNIPKRYLTFDPINHVWEDGELYQFLNLAIEDMNNAIPITPDEFNLETVPVLVFPIMGGQIYALNSVQAIETANFFDFGAGTIRVNLYKGDKYYNLANFISQRYLKPLQDWKKWYCMSRIQHRVVTMKRVPFRVLRPLSTVYHYHSMSF